MKLQNTPVTEHQFNHIHFYLKRDDQLHPQFSGNKARKLMPLLEGDFPNITTLISYGSPQANSLYSLAALAQLKNWTLEFYVDHIPSFLKKNPSGNYREALQLGATIFSLAELKQEKKVEEDYAGSIVDYIQHRRKPNPHNERFIPEGGHSKLAEYGVKQLAHEISTWKKKNNISNLTVALPSGTGTTALFLHKYLKAHQIELLTCSCVGGNDYLIKQFTELDNIDHPTILTPHKKHHFGKLYLEDYQIWASLYEQTGVEFDLLYDPLMWHCLNRWAPQNKNRTLLYIHQGGLLGNESMLQRYQRKFPNASFYNFLVL